MHMYDITNKYEYITGTEQQKIQLIVEHVQELSRTVDLPLRRYLEQYCLNDIQDVTLPVALLLLSDIIQEAQMIRRGAV